MIAVPSDEFLQRLRNWQIALSAPGVQQPAEPSPSSNRYGLPPPAGPISLPEPPTYQPQPQPPPAGGYYPPPTGGYYPPPGPPKPTPPPVVPTLPTHPPTHPPPPPPRK